MYMESGKLANRVPREAKPQTSIGNTKQCIDDELCLPDGIKVVETSLVNVSHFGVFCCAKTIKKGTRYGPFTGRNITPADIFSLNDTSCCWEVRIHFMYTCMPLLIKLILIMIF